MTFLYALKRYVITLFTTVFNRMNMGLSKINIQKKFRSCGLLFIRNYAPKGSVSIGRNCTINSCRLSDPIGGQTRTILLIMEDGKLSIGNNVGISNTAICCSQAVTIEDEVAIGANCKLYDTDFHSIHASERLHGNINVKSAPVRICERAFLGSSVTVLKGVTIGREAVIATGSIVTKDVPAKEVWGGVPARFLKSIGEPDS